MPHENKAWVSFCISTYKRPQILEKQLQLLAKQTFADFEVVVSDNDPEASAKDVVLNMKDSRFKYYSNEVNLGMIKSFNKSIDRANTEFVVMITDDDPLEINFLEVCHGLYDSYPGYSAYCGFLRNNKKEAVIEIIPKGEFITEILDPRKTINQLWSSAVLRKADAVAVGLIPDYGAPHLSDHAFIAKVGNVNGGVVINKMFGKFSSHESNFSKSNFSNYVIGCKGFYESVMAGVDQLNITKTEKVVIKHLSSWFIANYFLLKKYYTVSHKDTAMLGELDTCAAQILNYKFMSQLKTKFIFKNIVFWLKVKLKLPGAK